MSSQLPFFWAPPSRRGGIELQVLSSISTVIRGFRDFLPPATSPRRALGVQTPASQDLSGRKRPPTGGGGSSPAARWEPASSLPILSIPPPIALNVFMDRWGKGGGSQPADFLCVAPETKCRPGVVKKGLDPALPHPSCPCPARCRCAGSIYANQNLLTTLMHFIDDDLTCFRYFLSVIYLR